MHLTEGTLWAGGWKVKDRYHTRQQLPGYPEGEREPPPGHRSRGVPWRHPSAQSLSVGSRGLHPAWSLRVPGHNLSGQISL